MLSKYGLIVVGLLIIGLPGCRAKHTPGREELLRYPGLEWLSWSAEQRDTFVNGYLSGYLHGMTEACRATDELFETNVTHQLGHDGVPNTFPSTRCRAHVLQFSNLKVNSSSRLGYIAYTNPITEFYKSFPKYQDKPYTQLLLDLRDPNCSSAEDLYLRITGTRPEGKSQ